MTGWTSLNYIFHKNVYTRIFASAEAPIILHGCTGPQLERSHSDGCQRWIRATLRSMVGLLCQALELIV
jgi:hypothetical protein